MRHLWKEKAHRVIGALCFASYRQMNPKRKHRRHRPYAVPDMAVRLIDCLNRNDEREAKSIFVNELLDAGCYELNVDPIEVRQYLAHRDVRS